MGKLSLIVLTYVAGMPYYRRRGFGGYRRRFGGKRGRKTRTIAKRALSIARNLVRHQEVKHFDTHPWDGQVVPIITSVVLSNLVGGGMAQGTADNQRVGDHITVKGIYVQISFYVYPNASLPVFGPLYYVCGIVNTKGVNTSLAAPAYSDLFDTYGPYLEAGHAVLAEHNFPTRYHMLRHKKVFLGAANDPRDTTAPVPATTRQQGRIAWKLKFKKGMPMEWESTTQVLNNLWLWCYSASDEPNVPVTYAEATCRVYYVDD